MSTSRGLAVEPRSQGQAHCLAVKSRDFEEIGLTFAGWDARFHQLSPGPFASELQLIGTDSVFVLRITLNRVIQARGVHRRGMYFFSLVQPASSGAIWRGRHLKAGQINVIGPNDAMDHRTSAGAYEVVSVAVAPERLAQSAAALWGLDLAALLDSKRPLLPPPGPSRSLGSHVQAVLHQAACRPDALGRPGFLRKWEEACLRRLLAAVVPAELTAATEARGAGRRRVACRAEEYMLANLGEIVTMTDLCREIGVSERTLLYAFQERFGMSPMSYFKARRLNAVRQELKDPRPAAVHTVATRWGFWHTGQFAADYRRLFGELPSDTLRQRGAAYPSEQKRHP